MAGIGVSRGTVLTSAFFDREVVAVARDLIGIELLVEEVGGIIVETEAYSSLEPASHSFAGSTGRNRVMFGEPGHAYVYRSYGIHWCLNFVCRRGDAVLIRALDPKSGIDIMRRRRRLDSPKLLCSGPGRLTEALAVDKRHDGLPLNVPPFGLQRIGAAELPIATGPRIGISKAIELPWRFALLGSPFVSRKPPPGQVSDADGGPGVL